MANLESVNRSTKIHSQVYNNLKNVQDVMVAVGCHMTPIHQRSDRVIIKLPVVSVDNNFSSCVVTITLRVPNATAKVTCKKSL